LHDVAKFCLFLGSYTLIENMVKKNRSRFPIVILLTTFETHKGN
jgi:hypothetical protein